MLAVTPGGGVPGELRVDAAMEALERRRRAAPLGVDHVAAGCARAPCNAS